jgi:hypothetical protein
MIIELVGILYLYLLCLILMLSNATKPADAAIAQHSHGQNS